MATFKHLSDEARKLGYASEDGTIKKLARVIQQLCDRCEQLERTANTALEIAKRAKSEAAKKK